jgi:vanillate O-demethylase monooxygenase subunit
MTWLRNAWYAAGFDKELDDLPLIGRQILGEPVLLYRAPDGSACAIGNRCPHRFAPLHRGRLVEGPVRCGYHGLGFDRTGKCVHNPHGPAGALAVPAYPLVERSGLLWIWMGDRDLADPSNIPSFDCLDTSRFHVGYGYLYGAANYELMSDNILDLSHIEFLHPALGTEQVSRAKVETRTDGDSVVTSRRMIDEILPQNLARVYATGDRLVNRTMEVSWQAPATMLLSVNIETADEGEPWRTGSQSLHMFTPETERSTHYFYTGSLPRAKASAEVHQAFLAALGRAFVNEDKAMIDAQQAMIGALDIMELKPALLPIDRAAILARRTLRRLIATESGELAQARAQREDGLCRIPT